MANSWLQPVDSAQQNGIKHLFPKFEKYIVKEKHDSFMTIRFEFDNRYGCWVYCADNASIPELWYVRIYKDGKLCEISVDCIGKENFSSLKTGCNRRDQITTFSQESVETIINSVKNFIA